jgi:hypothetical protein
MLLTMELMSEGGKAPEGLVWSENATGVGCPMGHWWGTQGEILAKLGNKEQQEISYKLMIYNALFCRCLLWVSDGGRL